MNTTSNIPSPPQASVNSQESDGAPYPQNSEPAKRRWPRRLAIALTALVLVIVLAGCAFLVYASDYYHATSDNATYLISTSELPIAQGANYLAFGDPACDIGMVFYPGAKVEYSAYAPLMHDLAQRGYFAVVVEMPFNFAFFDINAANSIRTAYPQVSSWWVGGHSLGGSMAAQYAAEHTSDRSLAGLVLLGSYTASNLSASNLGVVSIYGSNDQVINRSKLEESISLMPSDALIVEISGGNHASFGNYGSQADDGDLNISMVEQQEQTASIIDSYIRERSPNASTTPGA